MRGVFNKFNKFKSTAKKPVSRGKKKSMSRRRYLAKEIYLSRIYALKKVMAERRLRGRVLHTLPQKMSSIFFPSILRLKSRLNWMVRLWKWRNDLPLFYGIPVADVVSKDSILSSPKYESLQLSPLGFLLRKKLGSFSVPELSIFRAALRSRLFRKRYKRKFNLGYSASFGYKLRRTMRNRMSFFLHPEVKRLNILNAAGHVSRRKVRMSKKVKVRNVEVSLNSIWRSFINGPRGVASGSLFHKVFQSDTFPRWLTIPLREKITMRLDSGSWFTSHGIAPVSMFVAEEQHSHSFSEGFLFGKIAGSSYYLGVFGRGILSGKQLVLQPGVDVYLFKVRKTKPFIGKLHSYLWTIYRYGVSSSSRRRLRVSEVNSPLTRLALSGIRKKKLFSAPKDKLNAAIYRFLFVYSLNPLFRGSSVIPSALKKWLLITSQKQRLFRKKQSSLLHLVQKLSIEPESKLTWTPSHFGLRRFTSRVWYRLYSWMKTRFIPGLSRCKRRTLTNKRIILRLRKVRTLYPRLSRYRRYRGSYGYKGYRGSKGFRGYRGFRDYKGARNYKGARYYKGAQNYKGARYYKGGQDYKGVRYYKGGQDYKGVRGYKASQNSLGNERFSLNKKNKNKRFENV